VTTVATTDVMIVGVPGTTATVAGVMIAACDSCPAPRQGEGAALCLLFAHAGAHCRRSCVGARRRALHVRWKDSMLRKSFCRAPPPSLPPAFPTCGRERRSALPVMP
jgi:hypothetical protein